MKRRAVSVFFVFGALSACSPAAPPPPPPPVVTAAPRVEPRPPLVGSAVMFHDQERVDREPTFAFSSDGRWMAVEVAPHAISVVEARTGQPKARFEAPGDVLEMAFRADGEGLFAITHLGALRWSLGAPDPSFAAAARSNKDVRRAAWNRTGDLLAVIDGSGEMRILDSATGALRASASVGIGARVDRWAFASDILVTQLGPKSSFWDAATGKKLADLTEPKGWSARIGSDARTALLTPDDDDRFVLVDVLTGARKAEHVMKGRAAYQSPMKVEPATPGSGMPAQILQVVFSPDGRLVAVGHDPPDSVYGYYVRNMAVSIYDVATGKRISEAKGSLAMGGLQGFSDDGTKLYGYNAGGGSDTGARVFDVKSGAWLRNLPAPAIPSSGLVADLRPAGTPEQPSATLAIRDARTSAALWSMTVERAPSLSPEPMIAALSPADSRLAFSGGPLSGEVALFSPASGVSLGDRQDDWRTTNLAFSAAGLVRAEAGPESLTRLSLLDTDGGEILRRYEIRGDGPAFGVSADGSLLAIAADDRVRLFDARTAKSLRDVTTGLRPSGVAFSPDGKVLAAATYNRIRTFDVASGSQLIDVDTGSYDWMFLPAGELRFVSKEGELTTIDPRTGILDAALDLGGLAKGLWADGPYVHLDDETLDLRDGTKRSLVRKLSGRVLAMSRDSRHVAAVTFDGTLTVVSTEDGHVARDIVVPPGSKVLGFSDDGSHVGAVTPFGAWLLRVADGAFFRVDFVSGSAGATPITSLGRGHFDGSPDAISHVRLFVPGTGLDAKVLGPGPLRDAFRRPDPRRDFFDSP